ncbi:MAG: FKBP-type peptidyl-prolyl cis-trans isomerase [Verrucomicrobia bacterium]|nr:FKBP-type peptidyl-prolyl cis-trans isomerase [Verrucomicrobiota bacterium]
MPKLKLRTTLLIGALSPFLLLSAHSDSLPSDGASNTPLVAEVTEEIDISRLSEAFGHLLGRNLEAPGFSFDLEAIIRGMRAAKAGEPSPMTEEEYVNSIDSLQERAFASLAAENLRQAEAFLTKNLSMPGIVSVEEGQLQYRIESKGDGALVQSGGSPLIHYTGRYMDGSVFSTSRDGDPIALPLDQTIPGFSRGIVGMQQGEKRTLFVHPNLGYGVCGQLPPNSLLVFEVEVIEAQKGQES